MKHSEKLFFMPSRSKNVVIGLFLAMTMLFGTGTQVYATSSDSSQSDTDSLFDVAIVIDTSGSMKDSDPKHEDGSRNSTEGAKMFIDMSMYNDSQAFIISYGYGAKLEGKGRLTSKADKQTLKDMIDDIEFPDHNGTDTGAALKLAQKTLEEYGEEGHQKCIILFTDGDIEYATKANDKNSNKKSEQQSLEVSLWGNKSQGDCPIFALGLSTKQNGKASISSDGKKLIDKLASNSGGLSKVIYNSKQIKDFYMNVFGFITDANVMPGGEYVATGAWQEATVTIPNSSVKKANILLLTSAKVDDLKLYNTKGKEQKFNSTDCVLSRETTYSIIELTKPEKGDWKLKFKAPKGVKIQANFFFLYDEMISVQSVKPQSGDKNNAFLNQPITVECYLKTNDTRVEDPDVYKDIKGEVRVINTDTDELAYTFDLAFDAKKALLTGSFTPDKFGNYAVSTELQSASFHRKNGPTNVKVIDHAPVNTQPIGDYSLRVGDKDSLHLDDYFEDPDSLGLTYSIEAENGTLFNTSCDVVSGSDTVLNLHANKRGSDTLTVTATDPGGNTASASFTVKAKTLWDIVFPWFVAGIILVVLSIFALIVWTYMRRLNGFMHIISYDDSANQIALGDDYLYIAQERNHSETLLNLIRRYAADKDTANGPLAQSLTKAELKSVLSSIILTGAGSNKIFAVAVSYKKGGNPADVSFSGENLAKKKKVLRIEDFSSTAYYQTYTLEIRWNNGRTVTIVFEYTPRR